MKNVLGKERGLRYTEEKEKLLELGKPCSIKGCQDTAGVRESGHITFGKQFKAWKAMVIFTSPA